MWYERRREKSAAQEVFVFECILAFQAWKAGAACLRGRGTMMEGWVTPKVDTVRQEQLRPA